MHLVAIGGSDAGISAALRARVAAAARKPAVSATDYAIVNEPGPRSYPILAAT